MSEPSTPSYDEAQPESQRESERKRRLAEVFGDVLPETTSDEREPDSASEEPSRDAWLRDQVPPHH